MAKPVPIGTRAEVTRKVELKNTLKHHHEKLPPVLTTPDMIGWMEFACYQATIPFEEDGETTVGTHIDVSHRAPTGVGATVRATAVLEKIDGRFHIFRVQAWEGERLIGEGTVDRAFVHVSRFMDKHAVPKASG
jgi:fluoroacetyl-CoA thioesterase